MNSANLTRLIALAAIWGASFLFMRVTVPVLGPMLLIESRLFLAALFLLVAGYVLRQRLQWRQHWRHYLRLGFFNSALPFLFFAYAALTLTASMLAILNATAPMWGAAIAMLWGRAPVSAKKVLGLLLGVLGVFMLVGPQRVALQAQDLWAIAAGLAAALCYGIASYQAQANPGPGPFANAHGSMWASSLMVLPALPFFPAPAVAGPGVVGAVLTLGLVCTGLAYLLYFRLIAEVGAASALTVAFLIPMFGILWGYVFLDEVLGWHLLSGAVLVVLGTALVTGYSVRSLFKRKAVAHG